MKTSLLRSVLLAIPLSLHCLAQETLILQPDATAGKDAVLHGLATEANNNWGSTNQFPAAAWTFQGAAGTLRTVIDFDLSSIPTGSTVVSAYLSLYAYDVDNGFGLHSTLSGSNAGWLQRVTTAWNENTVTWNTQPNSTSVNQVATPQLNTPTANIIDLEVSQLVQDMVNDPGNSHGFLLRLQNETIYRRLNFASSDHANTALHPRLIVTYLEPIASDSCFTLQPGAAAGKDAVLHGLVSEANNNWDPGSVPGSGLDLPKCRGDFAQRSWVRPLSSAERCDHHFRLPVPVCL
ncbi:MAG: DNRLRE domain-containing protein [Flavobacteriales bacterium]|nr:DNRLRE domain-containing protein [Flavobacteriales bacterium]